MRGVIEQAHKRCLSYGIQEDQVYSRSVITGDALRDRILARRDLIVIAEPFMNQLYNFVRGSDFVAILTDETGCILSMMGDDAILNTAHDMKMVPGASMAEAHIGTNAMGTALATGQPLQVTGEEHNIRAYYKWTCSCAIIRDENNNVIGALDLTGYIEHVHSHTLGMVVAAVNAIENTLQLNAKNKLIKEHATFSQALIDAMESGIILSDLDGRVQRFNSKALSFFTCDEATFRKEPLWRLIDRYEELVQKCQVGNSVKEEEVSLLAYSSLAHINMTMLPIRENDGDIRLVMLKLKDFKKERKQVHKILSGKAVYTFDKIIGQSAHVKELINFAQMVADSKSTVLITGESGTGKEVFAHAIHNHSYRRNNSFVAINCASIPASLIESELFGYEEGSFTGAKRGGQEGKFEVADGGTIFLDEIGEMPLEMQTRLLRVIQEGVSMRIGSHNPRPVDVRIIAATNKDLELEVSKGKFRLDLFYRLKVLPLHLPALRERSEDIPLLISYFNRKISQRINRKPYALSATELDAMVSYTWPGNIRELENTLEWMINTQQMPKLGCMGIDRPEPVQSQGAKEHTLCSLEELEKLHIEKTLAACGFNFTESAKVLGVARNTLYRKVAQYDIECTIM